jgi:hypothetical protein
MWVAALVIMQIQCSQRISAGLDLECFLELSLNDAAIADFANYPDGSGGLGTHRLIAGKRNYKDRRSYPTYP